MRCTPSCNFSRVPRPLRIALVVPNRLPAVAYGGTERVVWWLAKALARRGHRVVLLANPGTTCSFAEVRPLDPARPVAPQLPADVDVVHLHHPDLREPGRPHLLTVHSNSRPGQSYERDAVFISRDHAARHGSDVFVHNGIDPDDYGDPALDAPRRYCHFLGRAAWRVKNVRGAIRIARRAGVRLAVLGGHRLNINMGFRFTASPRVSFAGMVGGERKNALLRASRGLVFPVLWHEPFGLAVVESLWFGCPVVGTPFGALPELVPPEVGLLSDREHELVEAVRAIGGYSRAACHDWVRERFTADRMAESYLRLYERRLDGETLNAARPTANHTGSGRLALRVR